MADALKEMFDAARFARLADVFAEAHRGFDRKRFLQIATAGLAELGLLQRLRRGTEALHATLPDDYLDAVAVLRAVAPRIEHNFVGLLLPDYVGQYGREHPAESLAALHFLTRFSSGEFAIREFLRRDLAGTLAVMAEWSRDDNEHVRRLASEGCRPRLPWSFRIEALVADPAPALPILENLRADPSLYVRKSVANHLNDITKDHPGLVVDLVRPWDRTRPETAWIVRHGLRTLIKQGRRDALALFGAGERPKLRVRAFRVAPARLRLGETLTLSATLASTARKPQRLVLDYAILYRKAGGKTHRKVFKGQERELPPGGELVFAKRQLIRDFTTRRHHPGRHEVELQANGTVVARTAFTLRR